MARTSPGSVKEVLGKDYDSVSGRTLVPYIDTANLVVDRVATCATNKGYPLTSAELEMIERWLSAHYYTKSDPVYQSKSTAGASASFVRGKNEPEPYKDAAISLDSSGCLAAILNRQTASAVWLGKPPSEQIPYEERA